MFEAIKSSKLFNEVNSIGNGQMARICYQSEMPIKTAFKKLGCKIIKSSEATYRFGVDYEHITNIIEAKANGEIKDSTAENNYEWVLKNKIAYNRKTDKYYLRVSSIHNGNSRKTSYTVINADGSTANVDALDEEAKGMVLDSYWNRPAGGPEVQNIKIENVISINGVMVK